MKAARGLEAQTSEAGDGGLIYDSWNPAEEVLRPCLQFLECSRAPKLDFVFTVCDQAAGEVCPIWPGQPMTAHWGIPDPAGVEGDDAAKRRAFADACHALRHRIRIFASLPLETLDRLSLRRQLEALGKAHTEPPSA